MVAAAPPQRRARPRPSSPGAPSYARDGAPARDAAGPHRRPFALPSRSGRRDERRGGDNWRKYPEDFAMPCGQHGDERVKPNGTTHTYDESTSPDGGAHQERRTRTSDGRSRASVGGSASRARPLRTSQCRCQMDFARMSATCARSARRAGESGSLFDSVTRTN